MTIKDLKHDALMLLSPKYRRKVILTKIGNRLSAWEKAERKGMGQVNHPTIRRVSDEIQEIYQEIARTL